MTDEIDVQSLQTQVQQLSDALKAAHLETTRLKVATEYRLPPELASRLRGDDETAIRADAADLLKALPKGSRQPGIGNVAEPPPSTRAQRLKDIISGKGVSPFDASVQRQAGGGAFTSVSDDE